MLRCVFIVGLVASSRLASAQQITVQQPVIQHFGVGTTVVVPDGGRVSLGSVGRGADSRSRYGFGPLRGSSAGRRTSQSGMSASATILDMRELDTAILNQAASGTSGERDWQAELQSRHRLQSQPIIRSQPRSAATEAMRLERLAAEAMQRGDLNVARMFAEAAERQRGARRTP